MVEKGVPLAEFHVKIFFFIKNTPSPSEMLNYYKENIVCKKGLILTDIPDLGENGEKVSGFCLTLHCNVPLNIHLDKTWK